MRFQGGRGSQPVHAASYEDEERLEVGVRTQSLIKAATNNRNANTASQSPNLSESLRNKIRHRHTREVPHQRLLSQQNNQKSFKHLVVINQEEGEDERNCLPFETTRVAKKTDVGQKTATLNPEEYAGQLD